MGQREEAGAAVAEGVLGDDRYRVMSFSFDSSKGLIVVRGELEGPSGSAVLRLALDTGTNGTLINVEVMSSIGYDPSLSEQRVQVTTGSGVESVPVVMASRLAALGREVSNFAVLCHTLPPGTNVDGLLGWDFLRGRTLTIDFRDGEIRVS